MPNDQENWPDVLDGILMGMRAKRNRATGFSPYFMVHGREMTISHDIKDRHAVIDENTDGNDLTPEEEFQLHNQKVDDLLQGLNKFREVIHDNTHKGILKEQEKYKSRHDKMYAPPPSKTLPVGTKVVHLDVRNATRKGDKMKTKALGPFRVAGHKKGGLFKLKTMDGAALRQTAPADQLRIVPEQLTLDHWLDEHTAAPNEEYDECEERSQPSSQQRTAVESDEDSLPSLSPPPSPPAKIKKHSRSSSIVRNPEVPPSPPMKSIGERNPFDAPMSMSEMREIMHKRSNYEHLLSPERKKAQRSPQVNKSGGAEKSTSQRIASIREKAKKIEEEEKKSEENQEDVIIEDIGPESEEETKNQDKTAEQVIKLRDQVLVEHPSPRQPQVRNLKTKQPKKMKLSKTKRPASGISGIIAQVRAQLQAKEQKKEDDTSEQVIKKITVEPLEPCGEDPDFKQKSTVVMRKSGRVCKPKILFSPSPVKKSKAKVQKISNFYGKKGKANNGKKTQGKSPSCNEEQAKPEKIEPEKEAEPEKIEPEKEAAPEKIEREKEAAPEKIEPEKEAAPENEESKSSSETCDHLAHACNCAPPKKKRRPREPKKDPGPYPYPLPRKIQTIEDATRVIWADEIPEELVDEFCAAVRRGEVYGPQNKPRCRPTCCNEEAKGEEAGEDCSKSSSRRKNNSPVKITKSTVRFNPHVQQNVFQDELLQEGPDAVVMQQYLVDQAKGVPTDIPGEVPIFNAMYAALRREIWVKLGLTWQREWFPYIFDYAGLGQPVREQGPKRLAEVSGGGNCFFTSISWILTSSCEGHDVLRQRLVDWIQWPGNLYKIHSYFPLCSKTGKPFRNGIAYTDRSRMRRLGVWATEVEVQAMATMLDRDIWVYIQPLQPRVRGRKKAGAEPPARQQGRWTVCRASGSASQKTTYSIFLFNTERTHYQPILEP